MGAAVEKTRAKAMPVVVATSAADGRAAAGRCRVGAVIPHVTRYCGVVGLRMKHREIGEAAMMGRREAVARGRGEQWRRRGMVGVGGCPCARRERERQRSREVGWVVVVVAGLCRRLFVEVCGGEARWGLECGCAPPLVCGVCLP